MTRVMTWNVLWRFNGDYRERAAGIAETLRTYRPDLLGLVETWAGDGTTQPAELAAVLGSEHSAFARTSLPPEPDPIEYPEQAGMRVGIGLVSRWPLLATQVYDLPHAQRTGPPPTALVATVDHPRGPLHVIVTCIEWEPRYARDQRDQAEAVAALAADPRYEGPLLVLGDLNAGIEDEVIAPLTQTLTDLYAAAGGDPAATTLDSAVPFAPVEAAHLIDRRIDHILGRPVPVRGAFIAGDRPITGQFPSDHYAVGVDLAI